MERRFKEERNAAPGSQILPRETQQFCWRFCFPYAYVRGWLPSCLLLRDTSFLGSPRASLTFFLSTSTLTRISTGLGSILMNHLKTIGANIPETKKIMLTCFIDNTRGIKFYEKLGYVRDEFSPSPRVLRNGTKVEPEYVILSKPIARWYQVLPMETQRLHLVLAKFGLVIQKWLSVIKDYRRLTVSLPWPPWMSRPGTLDVTFGSLTRTGLGGTMRRYHSLPKPHRVPRTLVIWFYEHVIPVLEIYCWRRVESRINAQYRTAGYLG